MCLDILVILLSALSEKYMNICTLSFLELNIIKINSLGNLEMEIEFTLVISLTACFSGALPVAARLFRNFS